MVTYGSFDTRIGILFKKINFKFAIAVDLNKCLKQIKLLISFFTCTPSE